MERKEALMADGVPPLSRSGSPIRAPIRRRAIGEEEARVRRVRTA